jgi:DNA-binding LacI/PurR family transcriptional regulator
MEGNTQQKEHIILPPELIIRESTLIWIYVQNPV